MSHCPICGSNNRKREQKLVDAMFEIAIRMHQGEICVTNREDIARYVAEQLRDMGFNTTSMGSSWGILN